MTSHITEHVFFSVWDLLGSLRDITISDYLLSTSPKLNILRRIRFFGPEIMIMDFLFWETLNLVNRRLPVHENFIRISEIFDVGPFWGLYSLSKETHI